MVCWTESAPAAHAVAAAMPFLSKSERVVLVHIANEGTSSTGVDDLADHLRQDGVRPEVRCLRRSRASTAEKLASAARECRADLVVMGAYGHSRMREMLFGGCTQSFLDTAQTAVLFVH